VLIFNFYKRLILNLRGQELITCLQILNRTLTMCSDKTLNYDFAKVSHYHECASKSYKKINKTNIDLTHNLG